MSNIHEPAPDVVAELSPNGEITTATLGASGPENVTVTAQVPADHDLEVDEAPAEPVGLNTAGLPETMEHDAALVAPAEVAFDPDNTADPAPAPEPAAEPAPETEAAADV